MATLGPRANPDNDNDDDDILLPPVSALSTSTNLSTRDTSAEAASLHWLPVEPQNQTQVVYIDASNPHWTCTTVLG